MTGPATTTVATPSTIYTVAGRETTTDAVLLVVPLVRAATGQPLPARAAQPLAITRHPHARARIASGGFLVVAGRPDLALRPAPAVSTTITVALAVPGEPVVSQDFTIPTGSALPVQVAPWALDDPIRSITGTVRRVAFPFPAVPAATVTAGTGVALAPFALALRTPLALDHAAGSPLRACTLATASVTALAEPAGQGDISLVLVSNAGIGAGTVLQFGDETIREHVIVDATGPDPGQVLLRTPVVHSAPAATAVATCSATITGPGPVLTRAARAGDGVLLPDSLPAAVAGAATIQVTDGIRSEIRAPHAITGADGHFRLAGVRTLGALELTATGAAGTGSSITTAIDPGGGPVIVDLTTP